MVVVLGLLACGISLFGLLQPEAHPPGRCPRCGYNLRASPERCPECGTAAAAAAPPAEAPATPRG